MFFSSLKTFSNTDFYLLLPPPCTALISFLWNTSKAFEFGLLSTINLDSVEVLELIEKSSFSVARQNLQMRSICFSLLQLFMSFSIYSCSLGISIFFSTPSSRRDIYSRCFRGLAGSFHKTLSYSIVTPPGRQPRRQKRFQSSSSSSYTLVLIVNSSEKQFLFYFSSLLPLLFDLSNIDLLSLIHDYNSMPFKIAFSYPYHSL